MYEAFSYLVIACLAVLPIYSGAFAALRRPSSAPKTDVEDDRLKAETLGAKEALIFPVVAGVTLTTLYLVVTYLSQIWLNRLLNAYFCIMGLMSNFNMFRELVIFLLPDLVRQLRKYEIVLSRDRNGKKDLSFEYNTMYGFLMSLSALLSLTLYVKPNWIVSNIFGISFAFNAIQMISLDSFKTGFVLLSGLFFYDIYFVFGSKIMVTVAKSIDAPIMITFPRDIFTAPSGPSTMLGLGDIVLPGIYIALNLRYDLFEYHRQHPKRLYERTYRRFPKDFFHAALLAYCIGLIITVTILHVFKAAQPALLYLVPACILSTVITAVRKSKTVAIWEFSDAEQEKME